MNALTAVGTVGIVGLPDRSAYAPLVATVASDDEFTLVASAASVYDFNDVFAVLIEVLTNALIPESAASTYDFNDVFAVEIAASVYDFNDVFAVEIVASVYDFNDVFAAATVDDTCADV